MDVFVGLLKLKYFKYFQCILYDDNDDDDDGDDNDDILVYIYIQEQ